MSARPPPTRSSSPPPRIPPTIFDPPTQRLLLLSAFLALQSIKLFSLPGLWLSASPTRVLDSELALYKWVMVDLAFLGAVWWARVPRLRFPGRVWVGVGVLLLGVDWGLLGDWKFPTSQITSVFVPASLQTALTFHRTPSEHRVRIKDVVGNRDKHLRGEHTVRVGGFSTASLNPTHQVFCLPSPSSSSPVPDRHLTIPLLFNNTTPLVLSYSLAPLLPPHGAPGPEREVEIEGRELVHSRRARASPPSSDSDDDEEDEEDEELDDGLALVPAGGAGEQQQGQLVLSSSGGQPQRLQKTQKLLHLPLPPSSALPPPPFLVRLKHVIDAPSQLDARIARYSEALVVECPSAGFTLPHPLPPSPAGQVSKLKKGKGKGREERGKEGGRDMCVGEEVRVGLDVRAAGTANVGWAWEAPGRKRGEKSLEGIGMEELDDPTPSSQAYHRALTRASHIPFNLTLSSPGPHSLTLTHLSDGFHNAPYPSLAASAPPGTSPRAQFVAHPRPAISFRGCSAEEPLPLLEGGGATLSLSVAGVDPEEGPFKVRLRRWETADMRGEGEGREVVLEGREGRVEVREEGWWKLEGVRGRVCEGEVRGTEVCGVRRVPRPSALVEVDKLHDCSGDVGIHALFSLSGTPPYTLHYTTQLLGEQPRKINKSIRSSRDELILTPEKEGTYEYRFLSVSDKNYAHVPIGDDGKGVTVRQVVHPPAGASFASGGDKRTLWSCEGGEVEVEIDLKGSGPWTLELQTLGATSALSGARTLIERDIKSRRHVVRVPILEDVDRKGGQFTVSLVSVEDASGCKKALAQNDLTVEVKRVKPTVRFAGPPSATILEGQTAHLPVRLTGDGPWQVNYRHVEDAADETHAISIPKREAQILVDRKGLYQLVSVKDKHCPGVVVEGEDTFTVDFIPRPQVELAEPSAKLLRSGIWELPNVCEGDESFAKVTFKGAPPFEIAYRHVFGPTIEEERVASVRPSSALQLSTSPPGQHRYEVDGVGDANYALDSSSRKRRAGAAQHRNSGFTLEQHVVTRPSATFKTAPRLSYCLGEELTPHPDRPNAVVQLQGTAPWELVLEIRDEAGPAEVRVVRVPGIKHPEWTLDLSPLTLDSFGPHRVSIREVRDASACAAGEVDPRTASVWVEVAETATVVPLDRNEDVCVGDTMVFSLGGTPPFSITYDWNGKLHKVKSKTPTFTRVAEEAGVFHIREVSHHLQQCPTNVDIIRRVRAIPSATVSEGQYYIEDIREGDQAEIKFSFEGTPPFTFTYERRENLPRVGRSHELGRVFERHTVTGVQDYQYSIFSSLEGTYVVSYIQDAYCRYPREPAAEA